MEEKKNANEKLSYEKLNQAAADLYNQNQQLVARIKQLQSALDDVEFNKLSFFVSMLFKVIDHPDAYQSDFVVWCTENIEQSLTGFATQFFGNEEKSEVTESKKNEA